MKILHIFSSKVFAGLERHVEELAFEQSKENSVLVIGPVKFEEQFRANYKAINMNQWRWSPFLNCELRKAIVQYAPDVVHTHGYKSTALVVKHQNNFLHIATIHGTKKKIAAFENTDYVFGASKKSIENVKSTSAKSELSTPSITIEPLLPSALTPKSILVESIPVATSTPDVDNKLSLE